MAKRMTDTDKWRKSFFKELPWQYKLFWFYILDDCNHAGIWHEDFEVAKIRTGADINIDDAQKEFKDKIIVFDNGEKWFIPDFIEFQYGQLKPGNRAHDSVIFLLNKYNLLDKIKGHPCPSNTDKDKEQELDMDKDIVLREKIFKSEVFKFKNYPQDMLQEFFLFFSEPNKSKTKMLWETKTTWDLKRRLQRWAANQKGFNNKKSGPPQNKPGVDRILKTDYNDPKYKKGPESIKDILKPNQ